jgi:hypothetical protein
MTDDILGEDGSDGKVVNLDISGDSIRVDSKGSSPSKSSSLTYSVDWCCMAIEDWVEEYPGL